MYYNVVDDVNVADVVDDNGEVDDDVDDDGDDDDDVDVDTPLNFHIWVAKRHMTDG
jgi:hypothetical protein